MSTGGLGRPDGAVPPRRGADCPQQRFGGGIVLKGPKSRAGRRTLPLPSPVSDALRAQRARQNQERLLAGSMWQNEHGLVFTQPDGRPLDNGADFHAWKQLLQRASVRDARLHDARHTAASVLLEMGVSLKVLQTLLGHSQISLTADTHAHVAPELHRDAAERMTKALWG